jgi:hypothetical protein
MIRRMPHDFDSNDDLGPDVELAEAFAHFNPEHQSPNYWIHFRRWILENAATELARRRLIHELTVGEVITSWARTVVPVALLAAVLAGLLLSRNQLAVPVRPIGIEELLVSGVEGQTIPAALAPSETSGAVAFASEVF